MKIGIYPMVADILHAGHLIAIEEAKSKCDYLIVALHCCPDYKNPVQTIYERFMQLRAVKWVDEVIPYQNKDDMKTFLQSFNFDIYFLGEDYKNREFENSNVLKDLDKEIVFLTRKHNLSSTNLKIQIVQQETGGVLDE